ncbi:hypothetical protein QQF64_031614 [Cirrhinus molitorella]|uniref:Uncharacterized protein n=1 Tax=Cirrhinus molitorella TaxID=172907 RepID=A0ABR3MXJ0_9TELE
METLRLQWTRHCQGFIIPHVYLEFSKKMDVQLSHVAFDTLEVSKEEKGRMGARITGLDLFHLSLPLSLSHVGSFSSCPQFRLSFSSCSHHC